MIRLQTDISLPRRWWKIPDLRSALIYSDVAPVYVGSTNT